MGFRKFSLNLKGRLAVFERPVVMGILNVTPDSFYAASRVPDDEAITARVRQMIADGASIIDIGGCSTRPGYVAPSVEEETARVVNAVRLVRSIDRNVIISADTFRASVAAASIAAGADMINDVGGLETDKDMLEAVVSLGVPYVLTDNAVAPELTGMDVAVEVTRWLQKRVRKLALCGVCDVIIDPGFGFGKSLGQNFDLMRHLELLEAVDRPLLVGVSRKSMIYKTLGTTPEEALTGTTVLNTISLMKGASILRVHDVREAVEAISLTEKSVSKID